MHGSAFDASMQSSWILYLHLMAECNQCKINCCLVQADSPYGNDHVMHTMRRLHHQSQVCALGAGPELCAELAAALAAELALPAPSQAQQCMAKAQPALQALALPELRYLQNFL